MTSKRRRHTPEQIIRKLQDAEKLQAQGHNVTAIARELGVTEATYYRWKNQYGGLKGETAADADSGFRAWLCAYAKDHPRWGYRRAYYDARAEGWVVNHKKVQRLWREEGLRVPVKRRRKRVGTSTVELAQACAPNVVWAVDFQFDADETGRAIKIASIVDEHTRECLGGIVAGSITGDDLIVHLDAIAAQRGLPQILRCDNGPSADLPSDG